MVIRTNYIYFVLTLVLLGLVFLGNTFTISVNAQTLDKSIIAGNTSANSNTTSTTSPASGDKSAVGSINSTTENPIANNLQQQEKNVEYSLGDKIVNKVMERDYQNDSVSMMTKDERENLEEAYDGFKKGKVVDFGKNQIGTASNGQEVKEQESSNITLNSILYFSPNNWAIWVNGKKITKNDNNGEIVVLDINNKSVKLMWRVSVGKWRRLYPTGLKRIKEVNVNDKNEMEIVFRLSHNQIYKPDLDRVIDRGELN